MKAVILMSLMSVSAQAGSIADGVYAGTGAWNSKTSQGEYQVSTQVKGSKISTLYTLSDGSVKNWDFELVQDGSKFFKVVSGGVEMGSGYCLDHVDLCQYEVSFTTPSQTFKLEETLLTQDGKLFRYGSKNDGNETVMWQESQTKE